MASGADKRKCFVYPKGNMDGNAIHGWDRNLTSLIIQRLFVGYITTQSPFNTLFSVLEAC